MMIFKAPNSLKKYSDLFFADRKHISKHLFSDKIIIPEILTGDPSEEALRFCWLSRSLSEAINDADPWLSHTDLSEKDKFSLEATMSLKKIFGLKIPKVISSSDITKILSEGTRKKVKQHFPSPLTTLSAVHLNNTNLENLTVCQDYSVHKTLESNSMLYRLKRSLGPKTIKATSDYLHDFFASNFIDFSDEELREAAHYLHDKLDQILMPTEFFEGSFHNFYNFTKDLVGKGWKPVFKFPYSASGFGVCFPFDQNDNSYDTTTLGLALETEENFLNFFVRQLSKNGQKMTSDYLLDLIQSQGIVLQNYLVGEEFSFGYYKPLPVDKNHFHSGLINVLFTNVLSSEGDHFGNIIHYDDQTFKDALNKTSFGEEPFLFHLTIELMTYLMLQLDGKIKSPSDYSSQAIEEFGIQIMRGDSNEIGIVEINARTPSPSINHRHILNKYGDKYKEEIPEKSVIFITAPIIEWQEIEPIKGKVDLFVSNMIGEVDRRDWNCDLVCFSNSDNYLCANIGVFINPDKEVDYKAVVSDIKQTMRDIALCSRTKILEHKNRQERKYLK